VSGYSLSPYSTSERLNNEMSQYEIPLDISSALETWRLGLRVKLETHHASTQANGQTPSWTR